MKNSYILLRSNKESGPFTVEQLEQQGLKPDDLVWVEGQSVAWLHPSQIPSLRHLTAPLSSTASVPASAEEIPGEIPLVEKPVLPAAVKTSVFVSMPATKDPVPTPETQVVPEKAAVAEKEVPRTKYEKPLDEIKDMYVKTLEDRKRRMANKKKLNKYLRYAAVVLGLVVAGTLLGITLQKKWNRKESDGSIPVQAKTQASHPATNQTVSASDTATGIQLPAADAPQELIMADPLPTGKESLATEREQVIPDNKEEKKTAAAQPTEVQEKAVEAPPKINPEEISPLVAVKSNDYRTGSFGGIRGLQLTVTNDSRYLLEKVVVELQYLKLGDEIVKSETVFFHGVPANGSQTLDIPASKRGIKVACRIRSIDPAPKANVAGF